MSKIVAFRDRVVETIRTHVTDLIEVDWYDGLFDEDDISAWSLKTPCAFVSVTNVPTKHHTTMEMNADLRCVVAIITQDDRQPRDADAACWDIIEKISTVANLNTFGDPNAGAATDVRFRKLRHPMFRREGISVGVVEWSSGLSIGRNRVLERDFYYDPDTKEMITQLPSDIFLGRTSVKDVAGNVGGPDQQNMTPPDEAFDTKEPWVNQS